MRRPPFFVSDKPAEAQPAAQQEEEQRLTQHRQPRVLAKSQIPPVDVLLGAGAHAGFTGDALPAAQAAFLQLQAHRALLLAGVAVFPAVETIYNVLITMTALTSLFPYVLLFAAYIKIKRKKVDKPGLYQMTKNKKWGCFLGYMELVICVIAIVCSALPVMTTFKENVVYEVEMIGGGLLVIVSGLWLWKRSGLKNKTFEIE